MPRGGARLGAGRPKKLNAEKDLAGTAKPSRHNHHEVSDPMGAPVKPKHVAAREHANAEWDRMLPLVVARKTMSPVYMATFAAYCSSYADYVEAELLKAVPGFARWIEEVTVDGTGVEHIKLKPHPVLKDSRDAQNLMRQHCQQLGITPATVTRVATNDGPQVKAADWLDAITPEQTDDESGEGESGDRLH